MDTIFFASTIGSANVDVLAQNVFLSLILFPVLIFLFRQNSVLAFEVTNIDTETPKEISFPVSTEARQKLDNNVTIPKEIFASAPGKESLQLNVVCFGFKRYFQQ